MEMREAIKLNVMFFNVEESYAENEEKRMREDTELLTNLQQDIQTSVALTNIRRIGKCEVGKTRPLRASVPDTTELRKLLKYAKKLRDSDSFSNVFIARDMTQLQRSQWKSLIKEKREKQEMSSCNGEKVKWIITKGQVVKHPNNGEATMETEYSK